GNHLGFHFGLPDNGNGLVDVQKNSLQAFQKMQPFLFPADLEENAALDAFGAPGGPLLQNFAYAHDLGHSRHKDVDRSPHSVLQAVHSCRISPTPMTLGIPATRMLKLQGKESCKGVMRKSFAISFSGSTPRFKSMVSFRP